VTSRRAFLGAIPALALSPLAIAAQGDETDPTAPRAMCEADIGRSPVGFALSIELDGVPQITLVAYNVDAGFVRRLSESRPIDPSTDSWNYETVRGRVVVRWLDDEYSRQIRAEYEAGLWPTCADLLSGRDL
jgi:hypothetical protein